MSTTNINNLTPAHLIHPGEVLGDELKARNISQIEFAKTIEMTRSQLNEYIKGKRDFTAELCLMVAAALNMDESIWLNLKQNYEVDKVKIDQKKAQKMAELKESAFIDQLPKPYLKKQGVIADDVTKNIENLRKLYGVDNLSMISQTVNEPRYAHYRKSEKANVLISHLLAWENLVKQKASNISVAEFSLDSSAELIDKLKPIFRENKNALAKCQALLASYGIKLLHQEKPEKCAVDGFCFWSNGKPAIGLSLRYKRIDNLAFTLMHELGHVYLHLPKNMEAAYIDAVGENGSYGDSEEETEANAFAQDQLIPPDKWEEFKTRWINPIDMHFAVLAELSGIHPAIPFGRFCFEMNRFKKRTKIDRVLR